MEKKDYKATIEFCSEELSVKDKIKKKDFSDARRIDELLDSAEGETIEMPPILMWATISVHNENSENKDYNVYLFEFEGGDRLVTSSPSCYRSFSDLVDELSAAGMEMKGQEISFSRRPSKNPQHKGFVVCNLV